MGNRMARLRLRQKVTRLRVQNYQLLARFDLDELSAFAPGMGGLPDLKGVPERDVATQQLRPHLPDSVNHRLNAQFTQPIWSSSYSCGRSQGTRIGAVDPFVGEGSDESRDAIVATDACDLDASKR
jgi:hypothetical protein